LAALLCKPPGAENHLASDVLDAEIKIPVLMEILWLPAFKHALGASFTKLLHRLASNHGVQPHLLCLGRKGLERGKAWNMKVLLHLQSQNVTS